MYLFSKTLKIIQKLEVTKSFSLRSFLRAEDAPDLLTINDLNMLEYFKTILAKVSFDKKLFEKELRKAILSVVGDELGELKRWCYAKFGHLYGNVLEEQFLLAK
ncbi:MAG: hypothetical protein ACJAS3_002339 [Roseivirga sp.]|jgi:hypothetical protein